MVAVCLARFSHPNAHHGRTNHDRQVHGREEKVIPRRPSTVPAPFNLTQPRLKPIPEPELISVEFKVCLFASFFFFFFFFFVLPLALNPHGLCFLVVDTGKADSGHHLRRRCDHQATPAKRQSRQPQTGAGAVRHLFFRARFQGGGG